MAKVTSIITKEPNPEIGFDLDLKIWIRDRRNKRITAATDHEDYWYRAMLRVQPELQSFIAECERRKTAGERLSHYLKTFFPKDKGRQVHLTL